MAYQKIKGTGPVREHFIGRWIKGYGRYMRFKHDLAITQANYIASQRLRAITLLEEHGWRAVWTAYEVSKPTVYRWRRDYIRGGRTAEALLPKSTRPRTPRRMKTDPRIVAFIRDLREHHPRLGKRKIKPLLDEYCRRLEIPSLAEATIGKAIERNNLKSPPSGRIYHNPLSGFARRKRPLRNRISPRFKASFPGELVQLDTVVRFENGIRLYILTAVDIFSRFSFAWGYKRLSSRVAFDFYQKLERVAPFKISGVKTDNGLEFLGEFDSCLKEKGVTHYFSYPRTPQSNAYVERFNRTIQEEFVNHNLDCADDLKQLNSRLTDYLPPFNGVRPHQALKFLSPLGSLVKNQLLSQMSVSHTRS